MMMFWGNAAEGRWGQLCANAKFQASSCFRSVCVGGREVVCHDSFSFLNATYLAGVEAAYSLASLLF